MRLNVKILFLIIALITCNCIYSQESYTRGQVDSLLMEVFKHSRVDDMLPALKLLNKSLDISIKNNYKEQEATCYIHFSSFFAKLGTEMDTALDYLKKAKAIYNELGYEEKTINVDINMAYIYHKMNEQKKFDSICKVTADLINKTKTYHTFYLTDILLFNALQTTKDYAKIDSLTNDFFKEIKTFKFNKKHAKTHQNSIRNNLAHLFKIYRGIALIELNQNPAEANKLFNDVLKVNKKNNIFINASRQRDLLRLYTYKRKYFTTHKKNKDSVLHYYKKADSILDIILDTEENLKLKNYQYVTYNISQKAKLKSLAALNEKNKNLNQLQILVIILIATGLIISTFFIVYFRKANKRIKKTLKAKKEAELKLSTIQQAIVIDLHTNFGKKIPPILSSAEIVAELIDQKKTTTTQFLKYLTSLNEGVGNLLFDLKDLIWSYKADNDSIGKLTQRMNQYVLEFTKNHKIEIIHQNTIDNKTIVLPHLWNRQILLIFKEAINTAYKFAKANSIKTYLKLDESNIFELKIIDNGIGFKENITRLPEISNLKERAASINCKLHVGYYEEEGNLIVLKGKIT